MHQVDPYYVVINFGVLPNTHAIEGHNNFMYVDCVFCRRNVLINPLLYGFTYAFSQAMLFLMYAVVFRFGAFQITSDNPVIHEDFNDVFLTFIALVFGAFSIGQATAFAPNYVKAKLSAKRIFALLDREPVIDNYDENGQKLVSTDTHT